MVTYIHSCIELEILDVFWFMPLCFIQTFNFACFGILMLEYVDQITRVTGTLLLRNNSVVHDQLMPVLSIYHPTPYQELINNCYQC